MATQTTQIAAFNDNAETLSVSYDTTSLLIETVTFVNTDTAGHLTVTITDPNTQQNVFGTPTTIAAKTGTRAVNVSGANLHMVQSTNIHGVLETGLPYEVTCSWSPN